MRKASRFSLLGAGSMRDPPRLRPSELTRLRNALAWAEAVRDWHEERGSVPKRLEEVCRQRALELALALSRQRQEQELLASTQPRFGRGSVLEARRSALARPVVARCRRLLTALRLLGKPPNVQPFRLDKAAAIAWHELHRLDRPQCWRSSVAGASRIGRKPEPSRRTLAYSNELVQRRSPWLVQQ
jgi:hypothetical protein